MQTVSKKVRFGGKIVGTVDVPVYQTIDELLANETSERILVLFNKKNAIEFQNAERNKHKPSGGKEADRAIAFQLIPSEKLAELTGDYTALKAWLDGPEAQQLVAAYKVEHGIATAEPDDSYDSDYESDEDE